VRGAPLWHTSGGNEPAVVGRRRGGGHRLEGRGATVSSGGGRGYEGRLRGRSELPVHVVVLSGHGIG
jgi:hypothetical protein